MITFQKSNEILATSVNPVNNAPVELPLAGPSSPVPPPPSPHASPGSPFPHFITVNESEMTSEKKKLRTERKKKL